MKLTMKTLLASPQRSVQPGETADFDRDEAETLLAGGFAVRAEEDPAVMAPAERPKRRRRRAETAETAETADEG